jgi:pantoate ligase / CMP/dCMP kinase
VQDFSKHKFSKHKLSERELPEQELPKHEAVDLPAVRLLKTIAGLRCFLNLARASVEKSTPGDTPSTLSVGLVPTMGSLHQGHLSLMKRARQENQIVLVTIFVNPLQFGPTEDFDRYPRNLEQDQRVCQVAGVDAIFAPTTAEMTPTELTAISQVTPAQSLLQGLCARSRPGHFQGVTTIVAKLLNLVQPDRLYLGQKDAQQLAILTQMVADLNFPVQIVPCPIAREESGLAYSSRNQYLSAEQKQQAIALSRSLQAAQAQFCAGTVHAASLTQAVQDILATEPDIKPEYVELVDPNHLMPLETVDKVGLLAIAAHIGSTRLIDNILLDARKPILAIDGPAGAGKSTVTRLSAQALGLLYLDTGAMYRAVTWLVLQSGVDVQDQVAIAELANACEIQFREASCPEEGNQVWINDQDVTQAIRSLPITARVSEIAAQPAVRQVLVRLQQRYGQTGGIAMEGRDIGTNVFPDAGLKIFLTASAAERARRRQQELQLRGEKRQAEELTLEQLQQDIEQRDYYDAHRAFAPFRKAVDAIEVNTDGLSIEQVTAQIVSLYRAKFNCQ